MADFLAAAEVELEGLRARITFPGGQVPPGDGSPAALKVLLPPALPALRIGGPEVVIRTPQIEAPLAGIAFHASGPPDAPRPVRFSVASLELHDTPSEQAPGDEIVRGRLALTGLLRLPPGRPGDAAFELDLALDGAEPNGRAVALQAAASLDRRGLAIERLTAEGLGGRLELHGGRLPAAALFSGDAADLLRTADAAGTVSAADPARLLALAGAPQSLLALLAAPASLHLEGTLRQGTLVIPRAEILAPAGRLRVSELHTDIGRWPDPETPIAGRLDVDWRGPLAFDLAEGKRVEIARLKGRLEAAGSLAEPAGRIDFAGWGLRHGVWGAEALALAAEAADGLLRIQRLELREGKNRFGARGSLRTRTARIEEGFCEFSFPELSTLRQRLALSRLPEVQGILRGRASFSGSGRDPDGVLEVQAEDLRIAGRPFGEGQATVEKHGRRWLLKDVELRRGADRLHLAGGIDLGEEVLEAVRAEYLAEGFRDVLVEALPARFSEDRSVVHLEFRIREGLRWMVDTLLRQGEPPSEAAGEFEILQREAIGRPLTPRTRVWITARLAAICGKLGHPDAAVQVTEIRTAPGRVRLEAALQPGPRVTIVEVRIHGLERTREGTVRQKIAFREGDLYRRSLEEETLRELYRLGIFRRVRLDFEDRGPQGLRALVVTVEEAEARELFFEPGWGSYEQLRLALGIRDQNLLGTARPAALESAVSLKAQRLRATLTDPRLFGTLWRADVRLSGLRREEPAYTRTESEIGLTFAYPLAPERVATAGASLRHTRLADLSDPGVEPSGRGSYDTASLRVQLAWDTRDDWFFPSRGQASFAALEHSDTYFGSEITFTRFTAGSRLFLSVTADTVLALRARTGFLLPGPKEEGLPVSERFFNGGENSVRSFREAELGPRGDSGEPLGGYAATTLSAELRRRLFGKLSGSLFVDWGNVAPNRSRSDQNRPPYRSRGEIVRDTVQDVFGGFRPAVGAGLQLRLPVGPVRLDLAFNPDRDSGRGERRAAAHLSVGMAF